MTIPDAAGSDYGNRVELSFNFDMTNMVFAVPVFFHESDKRRGYYASF